MNFYKYNSASKSACMNIKYSTIFVYVKTINYGTCTGLLINEQQFSTFFLIPGIIIILVPQPAQRPIKKKIKGR